MQKRCWQRSCTAAVRMWPSRLHQSWLVRCPTTKTRWHGVSAWCTQRCSRTNRRAVRWLPKAKARASNRSSSSSRWLQKWANKQEGWQLNRLRTALASSSSSSNHSHPITCNPARYNHPLPLPLLLPQQQLQHCLAAARHCRVPPLLSWVLLPLSPCRMVTAIQPHPACCPHNCPMLSQQDPHPLNPLQGSPAHSSRCSTT
mmetsp:Transcript_2104/g.4757  ORF Transcript_2104/g.4757 Transcript_2104/m.4757 type:complete len:201 (+) Transcript_2104:2084-2686(+)